MKTTPFDKNTVFLRGKVQGKYTSPKVSRLYVAVKDYQQKPDEDGRIKRNVITITFYGREGLKEVESVNKNDRVDVKGIMQSVRDPKTEKWSQECWGLSVSKSPSLLDLATKGEFSGRIYPEDENVVVIRGKVSSCHGHDKHWITLTVRTMIIDKVNPKTKYLSNTSMTWHVEDSAVALHELEREGTEVVVVGKIESIQRNSKDGRVYKYENVTVRDLKIISAVPKAVTANLVHEMKQALQDEVEFQPKEDVGETVVENQ